MNKRLCECEFQLSFFTRACIRRFYFSFFYYQRLQRFLGSLGNRTSFQLNFNLVEVGVQEFILNIYYAIERRADGADIKTKGRPNFFDSIIAGPFIF